jgi:ribosomal protein S4
VAGDDEPSGEQVMKRLEEAARRLDLAVSRLELAAARRNGDPAEARRLAEALEAAKAKQGALEETTAQVASRLDAAIVRLSSVLGP